MGTEKGFTVQRERGTQGDAADWVECIAVVVFDKLWVTHVAPGGAEG